MNNINDKDTTLTPLELINSLGKFNLDPCGVLSHNTANTIIALPNDGLKIDWFGRVWLNPPFSNPSVWLERLSNHNNGIALVLASTETKWFQDYIFNKAYSILFLKGRPKFTRLDYSKVSIMRGVILVAYGQNNHNSLINSKLDGKLIKLL